MRAVGLVEKFPAPPLEECLFYHAIDLPGVGVPPWHWDLRRGIDAYLGGVDVAGKKVLEVGPASGFVTSTLERRGASVVAVELAEDHPWDIVPQSTIDLDRVIEERAGGMRALRNAYWYTHAALGLSSPVFYGEPRELPRGLGQFDVSVLAAVLLHTRDPLAMLEACAARTARTIVVVERPVRHLVPDDEPVVRLYPSTENGAWDTWWIFSPAFVVQVCSLMGFSSASVTYHLQEHNTGPVEMFTVVASRPLS